MKESEVKLISGRGSIALAKLISKSMDIPLCDVQVNQFSDGEFQPVINDSIRGNHVFIIQSTFQPEVNLMELLMLIDACKRASARKVTVVMPYYGYARQDRKDKPRVSIASKLVADLITVAGASRVMTMDVHADQIQGFFNIPLDHLFGSSIFIPYISSLGIDKLCIAAPDVGSTKRARFYAQQFGCEMVICDKYRKKHNEIAEMNLIGDVEGKNVILVDDIIDTGNTLCKAADIIKASGALSVRAMCTHPVLSGTALDNLEKSSLVELAVSDSIPLKVKHDKIKVITIADLFARAIESTFMHKSINSLFIQNNLKSS